MDFIRDGSDYFNETAWPYNRLKDNSVFFKQSQKSQQAKGRWKSGRLISVRSIFFDVTRARSRARALTIITKMKDVETRGSTGDGLIMCRRLSYLYLYAASGD